jgi:hypothetical protein
MDVKIFRKIIIFLHILILIPGLLNCQQPGLIIELSPQIQMSQVIYVSDFDFLQKGNIEHLFDVYLNLTLNQHNSLKVRFEVRRSGELIADAITEQFELSAGNYVPEPQPFSNIDLNNGTVSIGGQQLKFVTQNFKKPSDAFQNEVLRGGKLPRAVYTFSVCLLDAFTDQPLNNDNAYCDEEVIVISNPTYIKPISPGSEVGEGEPEEIYTEFPVFQFEADLLEPQPTSFHVQIFKKLDYHSSLDEVLTTTPHLDQTIDQMVFNYEQFPNAQPLEPGTYLWRIEMIVQTSGGPEIIPSPAYAFIVKDITDDAQNRIENELVIDIGDLLRSLIGDRAELIIEKLNNYRLKEIRLNGDPISVSELYEIIDNYQGHTVEIKDLELLSSQE